MGAFITIVVMLGLIRLVAQPSVNNPSNVIQVIVQILFLDYLWAIVEHIAGRGEEE